LDIDVDVCRPSTVRQLACGNGWPILHFNLALRHGINKRILTHGPPRRASQENTERSMGRRLPTSAFFLASSAASVASSAVEKRPLFDNLNQAIASETRALCRRSLCASTSSRETSDTRRVVAAKPVTGCKMRPHFAARHSKNQQQLRHFFDSRGAKHMHFAARKRVPAAPPRHRPQLRSQPTA
jgi:hypothetical protein